MSALEATHEPPDASRTELSEAEIIAIVDPWLSEHTNLIERREANNERAGSKFQSFAHFNANLSQVKNRIAILMPGANVQQTWKLQSLQRAVVTSLSELACGPRVARPALQ